MFAPIHELIRKTSGALRTGKRRGTVLLLVLGSLALVLILAVVYAAIGKGDRRTARETQVRKETVSHIDGIGGHILDVIGIDIFNAVPEVTDADAISILGINGPIVRREAVDLPVTDFFFHSVPSEIPGFPNSTNPDVNLIHALRFRPDGGHAPEVVWNERVSIAESTTLEDILGPNIDIRIASDPFLAATRPVDLGGNDLDLASVPPYLRALDWAQISNFAPDGRFVNLYYLREGSGDNNSSGFGTSSLNLTRDLNGNPRLSLFDENGMPTENLPYEMMAGAATDTEDADWNVPAHWTMFQRRLFRPLNDPAFAPGSPMGDPGSEDYWAYQYADADGDGFLDSRWIELVDYSNPNLPVPVLADADMRFFVAARAIDLSSLVNVSTATDFLAPSTTANRIGSGPQDINLFKLLHFSEHVFAHAGSADLNANGGVNYREAFVTNTGQAGDYGLYDLPTAEAIGRKAYLRLTSGATQGYIQPFGIVPDEINANVALSDDIRDYTSYLTAQDRADYTGAVGSVYPGITAGGNSRTSPYSVDDLVELLTFHGINDDGNYSKLEQAMSAVNTGSIPLTTYTPLRSDSKTVSDAWAPPGLAALDAEERKRMRSAVDIRRLLTTVSGSRPLRSSILNDASLSELTENRDRKIILDNLVVGSVRYPNSADGDTLTDVQDEQSRLISNAFGVYLQVLAPNLTQDSWAGTVDTTSGNLARNETMTQFYGHMGPELAVRLAGHMALNFRDMADAPFIDIDNNGIPDIASVLALDLSDSNQQDLYERRQDDPSVATLRLSETWDPASATGLMKDLWDAGYKLDINELFNDDLIATNQQYVSHEAMILYGIEPQPFLSQVSSMTMYSDVTRQDQDWLDNDPVYGEWDFDLTGGTGNEIYDGLPSIDGEVVDTNNDFLFQALFFQIFNPFDVPIVLDRYYIEYGDSFYSVYPAFTGTGTTQPFVLQPHTTAVLWACNPGHPREVETRLANAGVIFAGTADGSLFTSMLERQIGANVQLIQLESRYAETLGSYAILGPADVKDMFHDPDPAANSSVNRAVLLWRDNPSYADPAQGRIDWAQPNLNFADRATDQLVDRMRDTASFDAAGIAGGGGAETRGALDRRLNLPEIVTRRMGLTVNDAIRGNNSHGAAPDFIPDNIAGFENYNNGMQLGVALWGSVTRHDDARFDSGRSAVDYFTGNTTGSGNAGDRVVQGTPIGALPAQVFESTIEGAAPFGPALLAHESNVVGDGVESLPAGLDLLTDFRAAGIPGVSDRNVDALWAALSSNPVSVQPEFFLDLGTPVFNRGGAVTLSTTIPASLNPAFGDYAGDQYIKVTMNQAEFRDLISGKGALRVGDMLLPLAVGAYRTPLETGPNTEPATPDGIYALDPLERLGQYEAQWTTLGEALAAAAGYSAAVGPGGGAVTMGPKDPFRSLSFDHTTGAPTPKTPTATTLGGNTILPHVLDRGQLRLDAFVPFIDMDLDGLFTAGTDIRRGLGVPMALDLFDITQAGADFGTIAMGDIDRPVMGTINVNTAEPEVLRLHPALAMDMFDTPDTAVPNRLWWPRSLWNLNLNSTPYRMNLFSNPNRPNNVRFADVGTFITAYRDPARYSRLTLPNLAGATTPVEVDSFTRMPVDPMDPTKGLKLDRETKSGIQYIRENPGLLSIGELFAARDLTNDNIEHQMGGFARDERTMGIGFIDRQGTPDSNANYGKGVVNPTLPAQRGNVEIATFGNQLTGDLIGYAMNYGTAATGTPPEFPGLSGGPMFPIMPDQVPDSYDEQLIQLNAVLNSMSVRSDYFAVWFIVHGYKESDTVDLADTDPLTPSFQARYLMILDRSNVTQKGQRPKVMAFVQLPMLPGPPAPGTF